MKSEDLINAIGDIDDKLLSEAIIQDKAPRRHIPLIKALSVAVCSALILSVLLLPMQNRSTDDPIPTLSESSEITAEDSAEPETEEPDVSDDGIYDEPPSYTTVRFNSFSEMKELYDLVGKWDCDTLNKLNNNDLFHSKEDIILFFREIADIQFLYIDPEAGYDLVQFEYTPEFGKFELCYANFVVDGKMYGGIRTDSYLIPKEKDDSRKEGRSLAGEIMISGHGPVEVYYYKDYQNSISSYKMAFEHFAGDTLITAMIMEEKVFEINPQHLRLTTFKELLGIDFEFMEQAARETDILIIDTLNAEEEKTMNRILTRESDIWQKGIPQGCQWEYAIQYKDIDVAICHCGIITDFAGNRFNQLALDMVWRPELIRKSYMDNKEKYHSHGCGCDKCSRFFEEPEQSPIPDPDSDSYNPFKPRLTPPKFNGCIMDEDTSESSVEVSEESVNEQSLAASREAEPTESEGSKGCIALIIGVSVIIGAIAFVFFKRSKRK